ncbi:MAG: hypothetical protein HY904_05105 [Deltaproteobacteria bacterium]|nr:hypothetical protein [Deltaproteobacteria bacterium]
MEHAPGCSTRAAPRATLRRRAGGAYITAVMFPAPLVALLAVAGAAPPGVLHSARAGSVEIRWLAAAGRPTECAAMQFHVGGRRAGGDRFSAACSPVRDVFSPGGRWALFLLSPSGPFHVVSAASLPAYAEGGMPDAVVYPAEPPGMPPSPARQVAFLGWRGTDAFEMLGKADGAVERFTYNADTGRAVPTCLLDGYRRRCAFPSPGGEYTVFVPRDGFHVVAKGAIPGFLAGTGGGTRFPAALPAGLVRPVFQRWDGPGAVVIHAVDAAGQAVELVFSPATGTFTAPRVVEVSWTGWPASP